MNIAQRTAPQQPSSSWGSTNDEVAYKFQYYDKNKDGVLDKIEFRALLKDVFSSQTSTQFLDDAIEETVWRESNVDLLKAKQAINSIKETFSISTPYSLSKSSFPQTPIRDHPSISTEKPFNSQGQLLPPPPFPSTTTSTSIEAIRAIPPPPQTGRHNLGGKPPAPPLPPRNSTSISTAQAHEASTTNPFLAKPPSGAPASNPFFAAETSTLPTALEKGPAPVRVLPMQGNVGQTSLTSASQDKDERRAFVEYINTNVALKNDPDVSGVIPITVDQIYDVVSEGWLFCKLLNTIQPDVIPAAKIKLHPKNAFEKIENHTLAIAAAKKLGCSVINIGPEDLLQGKPRLVLGLLWQIIKKDVLSKVSLAQHPEIYKLAKGGTTLKDITESSPEEVLLKWANHHLQNAKPGTAITNFSQDIKDGGAYTLLMNQVAPQVCNTDALRESDPARRARMIVENAKKLNCDRFVTAEDIVNGNTKLNLAFMADLFNKHSGLELPTLEEMEKLKKQNASLSGILDEAEARLRQILADGRLAYELQQEEILLYRQRKLKEQEELAEQEAMLRAQLAQEEMMLTQQKRLKDLALVEQEQFAREEQRKEELRVGTKSSTSSSHSSSSSRAASSSCSSRASTSRTATTTSAPSSASSYSAHSSSSSNPSAAYYSATTTHTPASSYSSYSASSSSHAPAASYPVHTTAPAASAYDAESSYSSYSSSSSYTAPPVPHYSATYAATAATAATTTPSYATAFAPPPPPAYAAPAPNPYNVPYPPQPSYGAVPPATEAYGTTTQTVYTEPPPVASYVLTNDSPVTVRKRGMFERVGKKIDRAFH